MWWKGVCSILLWLGAALMATGAADAAAREFPAGSTCHASAAAHEDYAALAARPDRWTCVQRDWSIASAQAYVRFDLRGATLPPQALTTRLTRFTAMDVTVIGVDGRAVTRVVTPANWQPATTDWIMSTPLPRVAKPAAVIVRIDGARHAGMLSDMRLTAMPRDDLATLRYEFLIAGLCGMLLIPLLYNVAFYRVLRERFLLWHGCVTVLMLAHTMITAGLINRFANLSLDQLSIASAVSVGGAIIAASLFSADLIEDGKLDPIHRRLLRSIAWWVAPWTAFYLFADGALRPLAAPLYLASFLPLIGLFVWIMVVAKHRGSRAVNFQIAAWTPVMVTGLVRIGSTLGLTDGPMEVLVAQHFAMGAEVIITSLGVADRFLVIRRQRDIARSEARLFATRADRDTLTGLYNRSAIERRFDEFMAQGFSAMAVIDLDRFKLVNDGHGHLTGDEVLRATAQALEPDEDTIVARLGGEEFLLLMRGAEIEDRAERRRRAIPTRVAHHVPGLEQLVTASMGLVEHPAGNAMHADFAGLYAHCDRLLYEVKNTGRNRMMRERMQSFGVGAGRPQAAPIPPAARAVRQ